ncbi:Os07g0662300 [Oryza sativa Japonica Group]|uniref:Os07g0662300 protein n=2 Tax=Oryza TaxID=4527 RepID=A0A0N7KP04_ORYSJ|nr:Os07g0662300 [Oryza sativa Japonica Group]
MADTFPELSVTASDCIEMMWIQSMLYFAFYGMGKPLEMLLDRGTSKPDKYLKAKPDSVRPRTCPAKSGRPPGAGS